MNRKHLLVELAGSIDWAVFEREMGALYVEKMGCPGLPIRLLVGFEYLKYICDVSDEGVVEGFLENPYWQYFCGYAYFQQDFPCDATSLVKWRQRVGLERMEKLLQETIATAQLKEKLKLRDAVDGNPYDGHTLKAAIDQMQKLAGARPKEIFVDRGYRGTKHHPPDAAVYLSGRRGLKGILKACLRRRSAIDPAIGHLKLFRDSGQKK